MNEKSTLSGKALKHNEIIGQGAKAKPKAASRKRSYRPVQYGLVVTAFLASFMGTVWLQNLDANAVDSLAVTLPTATTFAVPTDSVIAEAPAAMQASAQTQHNAEALERDEDEDKDENEREHEQDDDAPVIAVLPTPTATVPTLPTPTPAPATQESAPSAQLAAPSTSRSTRAVARSRSSR